VRNCAQLRATSLKCHVLGASRAVNRAARSPTAGCQRVLGRAFLTSLPLEECGGMTSKPRMASGLEPPDAENPTGNCIQGWPGVWCRSRLSPWWKFVRRDNPARSRDRRILTRKGDSTLASNSHWSQPEASAPVELYAPLGVPVFSPTARAPSLSRSSPCRPLSTIRAICAMSACTDPCGECPVTGFPATTGLIRGKEATDLPKLVAWVFCPCPIQLDS
jgi:hypothetical protein